MLTAAFALTSGPWLARAQGAGDGAVIGAASLPRDLSPLGMYLSADPVVKAVLLCLVFASMVTWTVWLAKTIEIVLAKRRVRAALDALGTVRSTPDAVETFRNTKGEVGDFVDAASLELHIQNAADAIDAARSQGLLAAGKAGKVSISFDHAARSVAIRDRGAGIGARVARSRSRLTSLSTSAEASPSCAR